MSHDPASTVIDFYDRHPINEHQILEKLAADGHDPAHVDETILQNYDQDHFGGVAANDALADLAGIDASTHILDVCCGLGGPARYLAHTRGCRANGIDLARTRIEGARNLTTRAGLHGRVEFQVGNALANPFLDRSFDVVLSQEAFCHIPQKARLVAECVRVLKAGGRFAFTDIVTTPLTTLPMRERLTAEMTFQELASPADYRAFLEAAGCTVVSIDDLGPQWAEILQKRLAMYRSLKSQTVARFGADHFEAWDAAYAHFVGLYQTGALSGARILARRPA